MEIASIFDCLLNERGRGLLHATGGQCPRGGGAVVPWGGAAQGAFNCAACERVLIIQYV